MYIHILITHGFYIKNNILSDRHSLFYMHVNICTLKSDSWLCVIGLSSGISDYEIVSEVALPVTVCLSFSINHYISHFPVLPDDAVSNGPHVSG